MLRARPKEKQIMTKDIGPVFAVREQFDFSEQSEWPYTLWLNKIPP
jgi:hypothetical protein